MSKFWVNKFEVVGIKPGKVVLPGYGTLDLSDESLPMDRVQGAYDRGCPYLKLKNVKESEKGSDDSSLSDSNKEIKEKKPSTKKNPS